MRPSRAAALLGAGLLLLAGGCLAPAGSGNMGMGGLRGTVVARARAGTEQIYSPPPPPQPPPPPEPPPQPGKKPKKAQPAPVYIPPPPPFPLLDYASLRDIVVWVEPARGAGRPSKEEIEDPGARLSPLAMTEMSALEVEDTRRPQKGPRAVPVESILKITNFADEPLTFFSVSEGNELDTGPLRPGESFEWHPKRAGVVELLCDERAEWRHALAVVPTLRHAQVSSGRSFDWNDLPVGVYKLTAWHWRLPLHESIVEVRPGEWTRVEVTLSVDALRGAR